MTDNDEDPEDAAARDTPYMRHFYRNAEKRRSERQAQDAARARGKPSIPNPALLKHLRDIKARGTPAPAADKLFPDVVAAFPNYHVTRQDVRTVHKEVWPGLRPGKRPKQAG